MRVPKLIILRERILAEKPTTSIFKSKFNNLVKLRVSPPVVDKSRVFYFLRPTGDFGMEFLQEKSFVFVLGSTIDIGFVMGGVYIDSYIDCRRVRHRHCDIQI